MIACPDPLFPCTLVGSYPQPEWLVDRRRSAEARDGWRIPEPFLAEALDDATRIAVQDQLTAGLDIVTDGEIRRESGFDFFLSALGGIEADSGGEPRVVGPLRRPYAICVQDARFLRALTGRKIKFALPGPFTLTQRIRNEYYPSERECARAFAGVLNAEARELLAAGVDVLQLDEPDMAAHPVQALRYGIEALQVAFQGLDGVTCVHIGHGAATALLSELTRCRATQISLHLAESDVDCSVLCKLPDNAIVLGVLDLSCTEVEPAEKIRTRVYTALEYVSPRRLVLAPDCGMKDLPRAIAFGKLLAMCQAARELRREFSPLHKRTRRASAVSH